MSVTPLTPNRSAAGGAAVLDPGVAREQRASLETARVLQTELESRISGEVRFDPGSRLLYSTDASNYQIEPIGVVIPRNVEDVLATIELASSHGVPLLPRGGGSSLAGQTVGAALVLDFSKYLSRVLSIDPEARTVTVEPGINLDALNRLLKPSGLMFGPDPSSSNRATAGGVVGNNSTGAHSILYGMTSDNLHSAKVALYDGGVVDLGPMTPIAMGERAQTDDPTGRLYHRLLAYRARRGELIERDFPPHWRRATGYSLDQFLKPDDLFNPARLVVSSEGTLATSLQLTFNLVPLPKQTALVLLQFDNLVEGMAATPDLLTTEPSAIELMDRMLVNLTRSQPGYASKIAFIEGDPAGILCVEYYGDSERELEQKCARLEDLIRKKGIKLSTAPQQVMDAGRQADVWSVRKAGLGLLMSIKGDHKPIPAIEDVSVPVEHLAEFVGEVENLVAQHHTTAAYYAHASAGCLHIRPLVNLKTVEGVDAMRDIAWVAADLAHRFGGHMSGEHGDGLQRSELNPTIFGAELYEAMREFKSLWDPRGLMNPGKKVDGPPMVDHLRYGPKYKAIELRTHLSFTNEGGLDRAIEMCNGAAVCRKLKAGTMCPSFMATRDERDSTRGRANALRDALAAGGPARTTFAAKETYEVMDLCLSCKACKTECPSSVDMAKLKIEFLAQYQDVHGVPFRSRVFGNIHTLSRLASPVAPVANLAMKTPLARPMMRAIGIHPERKMSPFQRRTFVTRWRKHVKNQKPRPTRGKVVYFHDTFATYNYPRIGVAAVKLLEAAGFEVIVEERRVCCGRPALSKGLVADAKRMARRNVQVLAPYARQDIPIIGTEPSCILTLRDEYRDLLPNDADTVRVAGQAFMLDEFMAKLDAAGDLGIAWVDDRGPEVFFHGHCHQKALIGTGPSLKVLGAAGCSAKESGAGCCGMAGSFGYEIEHYDVSKLVGEERLFPAVKATAEGTVIAVAGVSCRQQIEHFTGRESRHIAEVLASRIKPGHVWSPPQPAEVPDELAPTEEAAVHAKAMAKTEGVA